MKQIFSILSIILLISAFVPQSYAQQDCASAVDVASLPYSAATLSTTGMLNDYSSSDACGSTAMDNEDYVLSFTPAQDMQINVVLSNTSITTSGMLPLANIGLFITDLCPNDPMANCVASVDDVQSNPALNDVDLTSGTTYYIIISSANTLLGDETNVNFDIEITKNMDHDLGITSVEVAASSCDLVESVVGCYITNNGLYAETGFELNYSINGGPWNAQTYTETINPTESLLFEFTDLASFPDVGEYEIEVVVVLGTDENPTNNIGSVIRVKYPSYDTFPLTEDFESNNGYWSTGGTASSWEYGNPDELTPELVINSAASGDNIWVTNLEGTTNTSEVSYIESPCYDVSALFLPTIELNVWVSFSLFGNSATLQASLDGGATWTIDIYTFEGTEGWELITVQAPDLASESNVKFRINYESGFLAGEGIAIDDFTVKEAVLTDVGVSNITAPITGCGLTDDEVVTIEITNYGAQAVTDIVVDYSTDGGVTWLTTPETVATTINSGESYIYSFTNTCDLSTYGNYDIVAKTVQPGDEDNTNDEYEMTVSAQATIAATDYLESFETGDGGWVAYGTNSTLELAMPANTLINSAGEGDYAWVTNTAGFNHPSEVSYLESPCFDFTGLSNPKIKAMIQYETTQMLANFSLEYTIDNGFQWDTVEAGLVAENWYGGGLIPMGTWSGSSEGWVLASTDIPQVAGQASVKFRFVFNNGAFSMSDTEGVAIDLINIYDCTNMPTASFTYNVEGSSVTFTNESENATSFEWNFGDNEFLPSTSTEENPTFEYMMDGSYTVTLTAINECSSVEYSTTIDISTSVCETNLTSGIYPNPASSNLFVNLENEYNFSYQIVNLSGQLIASEESVLNGNSIDISNLATGVYYIKIEGSNSSFIQQFIKE
ncbi:MAG: T9SS type A sorting domain-containing protein [Bacteroidales bacterium]|nr:T9SS type A sorting domain-containing protein [Bacteroidales bacterium]